LSTVWIQIQAEVSGMVPHDIPKEGKFECWPSAGKIVVTLSWDLKGVNFVSFLPGDSSELCYTETFRILNVCLYQVCITIKMSEMLLHHDSARLCTSMCTIESVRKSEWTVLLHLPYILASHYQIFTCLVL
jgi:hypothetical protein